MILRGDNNPDTGGSFKSLLCALCGKTNLLISFLITEISQTLRYAEKTLEPIQTKTLKVLIFKSLLRALCDLCGKTNLLKSFSSTF